MSQACEHTWYTEGIIFHYIRLGSVVKVERSSGLSRKFREVLYFIYLQKFCFFAITFTNFSILRGMSYASASHKIRFVIRFSFLCGYAPSSSPFFIVPLVSFLLFFSICTLYQYHVLFPIYQL